MAITEEQSRVLEKGWGNNVHSGVVTDYILRYGSEEQCQRWLPSMVEGTVIGAIAMTEPGAGSDVRAMTGRARRDGDEYVIDATKTFITNGQTADLIIVAVKLENPQDPGADPRAITLIAVEADQAEGLCAEPRCARSGSTPPIPRSCSSTGAGCRSRTASAKRAPVSRR